MSQDPFRYLFRFCCDPGFNDEAEIEALERYVDEAKIDDVVVFANVEEINTGHMDFAEQDVYIAMMRRIQEMLSKKGITMSVNQWHSVMHADLGKRFRSDQHFRPMVDVEGNTAELCVCPLCTEWQTYIGRIYARYAQLLEPSILWVEDDFRLHNHDPLVWGGCFCPEHMRLYSERAGKELTRQEFLAGVLQPGQPRPYRKIWLDVARETMLSAARAISGAIREVSDKPKVGLMSSVPYIHAAEGRDWHAILNTLAGGAVPVDRIHLPGYQENAPAAYLHNFNMVSMMNRAMIPAETEVYPELENFPFSLFSKSRRFTRFQLISALPLNLAGITLDLYDLNGNGIVWEDGYQDTLRQIKPFLNDMTVRGIFRGQRGGVKILYHPDSSYTIHTTKGTSMEELYPQECFWGAMLPAMGIPYAYTDDVELEEQIVAVSGQVLRNYTEAQIRNLFARNRVLLSGDAAWSLCDMGLEELAGIREARWVPQNDGTFAYEQTVGSRVFRGRRQARASAIVVAADALDITYETGAQVDEFTDLHSSFRERTLFGQTVVDGKVAIFPFGRFDAPGSVPCMFYSALRQEVLQEMLASMGADFPVVEGVPYLEPHWICHEGRNYLYLVCGNMDGAEEIRIRMPEPPETVEVTDSASGRTRPVTCKKTNSGTVIPVKLPSMETVLVAFD